jgi:hypothetical protein
MKLLKFGVVLALVIIGFLVALASFSAMGSNDGSNDKLIMEDGGMTFKEETCVEDENGITCVENSFMKEDANSVPKFTGYTVKEKVFVPKYVVKEIVVEDKLNGEEREGPKDRIKDSDINVRGSSVRIDISNANYRTYIDSNSMDPLIDAGTTTIEVKPKYASEIKVGDIVAYDVKGYDYAFVHRVADIGNDAEGVYFVTKGDNYWQEDPDKVRFSDIEGIVVGILY